VAHTQTRASAKTTRALPVPKDAHLLGHERPLAPCKPLLSNRSTNTRLTETSRGHRGALTKLNRYTAKHAAPWTTNPMVEFLAESSVSHTKYPELMARTCPTKGSYPNTGSRARICDRSDWSARGMMRMAWVIAARYISVTWSARIEKSGSGYVERRMGAHRFGALGQVGRLILIQILGSGNGGVALGLEWI
jgi:hypothetical protein